MDIDQQTVAGHTDGRGTRPRHGLPSWLGAVREWPRRRWMVAAALVPLAAAAFIWAGLQPSPGVAHPFWGWPVGIIAGALAGLTLASYVSAPGTGRLLHVGCSPCAIVSAASVLVAFAVRWANPAGPGLAAVSVGILIFGLLRRLTDEAACPVRMGSGSVPGSRSRHGSARSS